VDVHSQPEIWLQARCRRMRGEHGEEGAPARHHIFDRFLGSAHDRARACRPQLSVQKQSHDDQPKKRRPSSAPPYRCHSLHAIIQSC